MPLCGVIGQVWVNGQLSSDLLEALTLGQWLHIGGKTSFGMGSYSIQFVDAPGVRLCIED
jgi:CRISPR/Cas system endoribonuclease Cas6 (RAMP superfamily)